VAAASLGNLAGSLVAFWLTKRYGERFLLGPGRRLGINRGHVRLANRFFNKYGVWAVFLGRLLPVIRTYISFPAGLSSIRLPIFVAATLAGAIPWNLALAFAGLKLGQRYTDIGRLFGPVTIPLAIALVVVVAVVYWFGRRIGEDDGQLEAAPLVKHPS
ncbi:MAG TPA: DedA family protein, partial [Candidatus Dormibacteraeota bacterium]